MIVSQASLSSVRSMMGGARAFRAVIEDMVWSGVESSASYVWRTVLSDGGWSGLESGPRMRI